MCCLLQWVLGCRWIYKYCFLRNKQKAKVGSAWGLPTIDEQVEVDEEELVIDAELEKDSDERTSTEEPVQLDQTAEDKPNDNKSDDSSNSIFKEQIIGDNIDLNIVSINGNKPFHAMGVISFPRI